MLKITKNQGSIQVTADKSGFYPFDGTITFPTNSLFTATSANTDMITFKSTSNGDVQFVGNYKDITISGRSYDTKQKFLTAFSNLANQGSVDAYTKAETDAKLKNKLAAWTNAKSALFIRSYSNDDARSSVALYNSTVNGTNDVAIGYAVTNDKEGVHNLAILNEARANGVQNIAIGDERKCVGARNVGIGSGKYSTVDVNGADNVCIGGNSQAHTPTPDNAAVNNSIAIGSSASAYNNYCTVIGQNASSIGSHSVAIGDSAHADSVASRSVAVGSEARAHGENSVALGYLSYATNETPLDICCGKDADNRPLRVLQSDSTGKLSILKGDGTVERMVIQDEIEALKNAGGGSANPLVNVKGTGSATIPDNVTEAVAIGSGARTSSGRSVAIGYKAETSAGTPMVINASSKTMIQSDANGKISLLKGDGTNERMVIQDEIEALKNAGGSGGTVDAYTKAETDTKLDAKQDKLTAGSGITITKDETAGTSTIATAVSLTDNGNGAYTVGDSIKMSSNAIAIGSNANINDGLRSVVIGNDTTTHYGCVTIGYNTKASGTFCTVIGDYAISNGYNGIAVGAGALLSRNSYSCIAIGKDSQANGYRTVSIGYNAQADKDKPLVINAGSKTDDGKNPSFTVLQSDATGKISILKGDGTDERMVISDEITALKAEITTLKAEIAALKGGASTGA